MSGKILCFLMLAILALSTAVYSAKSGLPEQVIPSCFGVNIHFSGDNDKEVKQIADAGFRFVRMDFIWDSIEKEKGKYDFTQYDSLMTALDRHGVRPLFILDYGNKLYDDGLAPHTDQGRQAFAAFARAAASHFKGRGILWEIWNEPNGGGFWHPKPNPEHYALLASVTAKAIHEADKNATVLAPALAGMDLGYIETTFAKGILDNIDVVSVHPYRGQYPETAAVDYVRLRGLIDRYAPKGKSIPIVSGEWGFSAVDMSVDQQAQYLVRQFLINMMSGVKLSIWYDWHDDGQDPKEREHHFGTVYWDFSPKPAYLAVQTLTKELSGCRYAGRLHTENAQDYVLLFKDGSGSYKLAAWTTDVRHEAKIPLDVPTVTLTGFTGTRKVQRVMSENLKIELGPAVTYVSGLAGSKRLAIEEAFSVEPEVLKQVNSAELPALIKVKNPTDRSVKFSTVIKDPVSGKAVDQTFFEAGPGKSVTKRIVFNGAWDGGSSLGAMVELYAEGMDEPFRRMLAFDTSRRFTVTAAPPANNQVLFTISNPSGEPFMGSIMLSSGPGMTVGEITVPIKLDKGQTFAETRYPVILGDRKQYSFRYMVLDTKNNTVYTTPDRTYKLVDSFEKSDAFEVAMDGSADVPGEAKLTTSDLPTKLPGVLSCTKLDYKFGNGWKFARIVTKSDAALTGKPKEIGIWIYGDKSGNYVRTRLTDSTGQTFQPHLATVDFEGWRFTTCRLEAANMGWWAGANDGIIHWPAKWDTTLLFDSAGGKEQSGEIYIGPMWAIY